MFSQGDKIRYLSTPLTVQMGIVGKYGEVLVGRASTGHIKTLTPTRAGLIPFWFPPRALKLCNRPDPRPPVDAIVLFTCNATNDAAGLTGQTGIEFHHFFLDFASNMVYA